MTQPLPRGTKTIKRTTASLTPGTVLLTTEEYETPSGSRVNVAQRKTGAVLRTVARTEREAPGPYGRQVRIVVHFEDGTVSVNQAPSQTWMATP